MKLQNGITNWDGPGSAYHLKNQCDVPNVVYQFNYNLGQKVSGKKVCLISSGAKRIAPEITALIASLTHK